MGQGIEFPCGFAPIRVLSHSWASENRGDVKVTSLFERPQAADLETETGPVRPVEHRGNGHFSINQSALFFGERTYFFRVLRHRCYFGISADSAEFSVCRGDVKVTRIACHLRGQHGNDPRTQTGRRLDTLYGLPVGLIVPVDSQSSAERRILTLLTPQNSHRVSAVLFDLYDDHGLCPCMTEPLVIRSPDEEIPRRCAITTASVRLPGQRPSRRCYIVAADPTRCVQRTLACQGLTIGIFRSSKCLTFLVASVARRAKAIPAICVSRISTGRPDFCRLAARPAASTAALPSKSRTLLSRSSASTRSNAAATARCRLPLDISAIPKCASNSVMVVIQIDSAGCSSNHRTTIVSAASCMSAESTFVSRIIIDQYRRLGGSGREALADCRTNPHRESDLRFAIRV